MSQTLWMVIVFVIAFVINSICSQLGVPFWAVTLIGMPLLAMGLVAYSVSFNFRSDLRPEMVPSKGFEDRLAALENEIRFIEGLGFKKVDQFYLKMMPDSIVWLFQSNEEPLIIGVYHMGSKMFFDVITFFTGERGLTTGISADGGNIPPKPGSFLQTFEGASYEKALAKHREALEFLKGKGLQTWSVSAGSIRDLFMKSIRSTGERIRAQMFWPAVLIYWVLIRRGRIYARSIEEQYTSGDLKIQG